MGKRYSGKADRSILTKVRKILLTEGELAPLAVAVHKDGCTKVVELPQLAEPDLQEDGFKALALMFALLSGVDKYYLFCEAWGAPPKKHRFKINPEGSERQQSRDEFLNVSYVERGGHKEFIQYRIVRDAEDNVINVEFAELTSGDQLRGITFQLMPPDNILSDKEREELRKQITVACSCPDCMSKKQHTPSVSLAKDSKDPHIQQTLETLEKVLRNS